ncbi:MAG: hypothetical protein NT062_10955 [Proteobacteria bacterium]|nr:hypothetical protein [Pseudomonadota bacterium]
MIGLPFNDYKCLGSITEVVAELVANRDPVIAEIAAKHRTTAGLINYIRGLPQKDDDGDKTDGPKVETCEPPQRLRLPAEDPNCVERAALYLAVAEMIEPRPVRQLATLDTPLGLHTFPVENGAPVILDPRMTQEYLECGVTLAGKGPVTIEAHDAIEWTANLAEDGSRNTRNGPSRVRRARNAVMRLTEGGTVPTQAEVDAIGWMFALAEKAAQRWGSRAVAMVRTTALAIADLAEEVIARSQRNIALDLGDLRIEPPRWMAQLGRAAGRVGLDVGAVALRSQLDTLGIGPDMVGLVEQELNREGLTMGVLARPPKLPTFANLQAKRAA